VRGWYFISGKGALAHRGFAQAVTIEFAPRPQSCTRNLDGKDRISGKFGVLVTRCFGGGSWNPLGLTRSDSQVDWGVEVQLTGPLALSPLDRNPFPP